MEVALLVVGLVYADADANGNGTVVVSLGYYLWGYNLWDMRYGIC